MRKTMGWMLAAVLALGWATAGAQEKEKDKEKETAKAASAPASEAKVPHNFYRLDFTIRELQEKKVVNVRYYSMLIADDLNWSNLKSGARIPVTTGLNLTQYIDVGVNIKCRLRPEQPSPWLYTTVEFTSPAFAEAGAPGPPMSKEQPILRQANAEVASPLTLGKPLVIASMDDPSLTRRFEVELTSSKVH